MDITEDSFGELVCVEALFAQVSNEVETNKAGLVSRKLSDYAVGLLLFTSTVHDESWRDAHPTLHHEVETIAAVDLIEFFLKLGKGPELFEDLNKILERTGLRI